MSVIKRKSYYPFPVYEFNLPSGWTCPFAKDCWTCVDRLSGKVVNRGLVFRCYASASERFPAVRERRWRNFESVKFGDKVIIPEDATHVRIHGSGDFFSQQYFDMWLSVCESRPDVLFWAFTKSIRYWVSRIDRIPDNLVLTASYGSKDDHLIEEHNLRWAKVYKTLESVPEGLEIDTNDSLAMKRDGNFALLDNFKNKKM